ncbi:hypothetical protein BGZ92_006706, partial [Podila epicladia]
YIQDLTCILMDVYEAITARRECKLPRRMAHNNEPQCQDEPSGPALSFVQYSPAPKPAWPATQQPSSDLAGAHLHLSTLQPSTPPPKRPQPTTPQLPPRPRKPRAQRILFSARNNWTASKFI